uniref:MMS1_N domain-containing protein n=1 Tax=Haemonchus contortus TaxID=6289 RepID=A0A7I4YLC6_HAECO
MNRYLCRNGNEVVLLQVKKKTGHGFKAFLCGVPKTTDGSGIIVFERFRDLIVGVERFDDRLMKIIVVFERQKNFFSAYAPQTVFYEKPRTSFDLLDRKKVEVPLQEGDLNGHMGAMEDGYSCVLDKSHEILLASELSNMQTRLMSPLGTRTSVDMTLISSNSTAVKPVCKLISFLSGTTVRVS